MGLDMYAYSRAKEAAPEAETLELQYWRKHNAMHGLMEELWNDKGAKCPQWLIDEYPEKYNEDSKISFNGVELELTEADLDYIEARVKANQLPETEGFFFGQDSRFDEHNHLGDLEFITNARAALARGEQVFYNSSW
jgi:hypothetical protein